MRSCFVPCCDILCKNMKKRMMFIPQKDQHLFQIWKSVLPSRRELKPTDRVCERHFDGNDIVKTFDHIINGVLHQIDRGKPKLRPNAVPNYNLLLKFEASEPIRKSKKRNANDKTILSEESTKVRRPIIERLNKNFIKKSKKENARNCYDDVNGTGDSINDVLTTSDDKVTTTTTNNRIDERRQQQQRNVETQETSLELGIDALSSESYVTKTNNKTECIKSEDRTYDCMDASLFDGIYEDIFEVTLPNTLWGLHRDPNRKFIVFSCFDARTCTTSKIIRFDSDTSASIRVNGKMVNRYQAELSIEYLTNLVNMVDEYRICAKFDVTNSKCEVVAVELDLCTSCRSSKV